MVWSLCILATFLSPQPECISIWPDRERCAQAGDDWLWRMLAYRDSQHVRTNIAYSCIPNAGVPGGESP